MHSAKTSKLLVVTVLLQSLILWGMWTQRDPSPAAQAQTIDPGAQRMEIKQELEKTNAKLDRLIAILEGGKLQVTVVQSDEQQ
jgi:hypothetical protein